MELSEGIMKYFRPIDKFIRSNHLIQKNAHTRGLAKELATTCAMAGLSVKETQMVAEARAKIIYLVWRDESQTKRYFQGKPVKPKYDGFSHDVFVDSVMMIYNFIMSEVVADTPEAIYNFIKIGENYAE